MKNFNIYESTNQYVELCAPLKIYYDITTSCNLDCEFCFKEKHDTSQTTFDDAKRVIKRIADANVMDVVFLGGEPLVCPFLFEAIEYAKESGLNVGIITNGTLFTKENAQKLKKLINNSISVSIHAHTNALHDEISGGLNVLDQIVNGLEILNQQGITPELAFTPLKKNVKHLYDTISNILNRGIQISDVLVNRLIPAGNAIVSWKSKEITLDDQNLLFEQMERLTRDFSNLIIATGDAIPFCMVDKRFWKYIIRCDYAITLGWINEANLFGKCMCRGSTGFDSLQNKTIKELWKTSDTFLEHRCLRSIPSDCRECDWIALCGGGCACSSYDKSLIQDAYFNYENKINMPKAEMMEAKKQANDFSYNINDVVIMKHQFIIRKENDFSCIYDDAFLLIPLSSGAIIQDVIQPEDGKMMWVNSIEKQIAIYLKTGNTVFEIGKSISYEFNISLDSAISHVKNAINFLSAYDMVLKNER